MSTSDFIDAMDSISRDLEREKEEMAALLQRKGAGHVERLKRRIERDLSEVEEAIERAQDKMREEVERVVKRYGPETTPVERREAAEEVARGFGSDLFAEAMRRLHEAAQQTEDTRRQKARKGRYKHAARLVRTLNKRQRRREDLRFRLRAVQDALRRWALGEFDEQQEPEVQASRSAAEASEQQRKLAKRGLELYDEKEHTGRKALLDDMTNDERVQEIVGVIDRRSLQDALGPLYVSGRPGRPTKEEEKSLLSEMIALWDGVKKP